MTMFPKTAPIRLKGKALEALREAVYERDGGCCVDCDTPVRLEGGYWDSMHLMHRRSRGANGSDTAENTDCGCLKCHMFAHAGSKPCPPKVQVQEVA